MQIRLFLLLITCVILTTSAVSQTKNNNHFIEYNNKGEVYFKLALSEVDNIQELAGLMSVDGISNDQWILGYSNKEQFGELLNSGIKIELLPHPGTLIKDPVMKGSVDIKAIDDWDFYPTYSGYLDMMNQFQANYPTLCEIKNIGQSIEGRDLLVAVISDQAEYEEGEPQFLYTATIHGDETAGYVIMLRFIDYLLSNYGSNDRITHMVDHMEIWINPLANPDGIYAGGNNTISGAKRFNANNVDLNRNFPDPEDGDHPDGNEWQTETIHFMTLAEENSFVMSANLHGGAEVCNYPWDTWSQLHADDNWWQMVCREYADTAQHYSPAGYLSGFDNGITNGYAWYTISGGRQDYMNYFHHCREFTLEMSNTKVLPANLLPDWWEYNYRSLLNYMEQGTYGIQGQVTNDETGVPVRASIFIENHDVDESWVQSRSSDGWYFRPTFEGAYDLTFSAPDYDSKIVTGVQVVNGQVTTLDVEMTYNGSAVQEPNLISQFKISNNPGNGFYHLMYQGDQELELELFIYTASGYSIEKKQMKMVTNSSFLTIDISDQDCGIYLLNVKSEINSGTIKLIKTQ